MTAMIFRIVIGVFCVSLLGTASAQPLRSARSEHHVLVKFRADGGSRLVAGERRDPAGRLLRALRLPAGGKLRETGWTQWKRASRTAHGARADAQAIDFEEFLYLDLPPGLSPEACVARLRRLPFVEAVETDPYGWGGATPTDPDYAGGNKQWHVGGAIPVGMHINTRLAWDITTGSSNVVVAVLDSGIASNLAEFAGRVVAGYDFVNNDADAADDQGHGTAVASTLAATGMNGNRGVGVDWQCRIMPVKVLEPDPGDPSLARGSYSWWVQGINWAVANGAKVINLSAGGWSVDTNNFLHNAITNAIAQGCVFVTITHNNPAWGISYPGLLPECITVGGTDEVGSNCTFSAHGPEVDLVAPATNIYTVTTGNTWRAWWGTSLAAPQVSGVAALVCAVRPGMDQDRMRALLCAGASDQGQRAGFTDPKDTRGFDSYYGWGRLDAYASLVLALTEIDRYGATNNGDQVVSWMTPPNASNSRPYRVEVAYSPTSSWMTATGVVYGSSRALWRDDGVETGVHPTNSDRRVYRVRLKAY